MRRDYEIDDTKFIDRTRWAWLDVEIFDMREDIQGGLTFSDENDVRRWKRDGSVVSPVDFDIACLVCPDHQHMAYRESVELRFYEDLRCEVNP